MIRNMTQDRITAVAAHLHIIHPAYFPLGILIWLVICAVIVRASKNLRGK